MMDKTEEKLMSFIGLVVIVLSLFLYIYCFLPWVDG